MGRKWTRLSTLKIAPTTAADLQCGFTDFIVIWIRNAGLESWQFPLLQIVIRFEFDPILSKRDFGYYSTHILS